ncbi:MAG TPA: hypothetical protein PLO17_19480 [Alcaligenes phenolicus]|uniref:hypothetical protein n=1 Tax=Alcaligenes phenolicus TaxID=232846 RepID=UPI002D0005D0|nr:hypothetical protein [Alcaligenes phenolicus]HRO22572.1 hypothetical protein [Alcaligenes phenolicus]
MLRNLHLLMALSSDSGSIVFAPKLAEHPPVQGLRIYFPSGHPVRADKVSYWMRRLTSDPVNWITPSEKKWRIDLDAAKRFFASELLRSGSRVTEPSWPSWLSGTLSIEPEFETGADFRPRLAFYITEVVVAQARNPVPAESGLSVFIGQYVEGGYRVSSDQYNVSNISGQVGAIGTANNLTGATLSQAATLQSVDLGVLAAELSQLKAELKSVAAEVDQEFSVANVAAAEAAAKKGDSEGVAKYLKAAGKWALDTATKIGTQVAVKAIENALKGP